MKEDVRQWELVADWIGIPPNKRLELVNQNPTTDQAKQACWNYWLHYHPAPSWRILAGGLYFWGKHGALEVLQMNYLKGVVLHIVHVVVYRRNWLLSACAYNMRQQENMRLTKSMRLTGSMRLIKSAKTR